MNGNIKQNINSLWIRLLSVLMAVLMVMSIGEIAFSTITHGASMTASSLQTLLNKGGEVKLTNNITCKQQLKITKSTTIKGQGHTITFDGLNGDTYNEAILISASTKIFNLNLVAKGKGYRAIRSTATLDYCGGSIKNFNLNPTMADYYYGSSSNYYMGYGGGILFHYGGGILRGGVEISGCKSGFAGGGVACTDKTLTINGAYIHGNSSAPSDTSIVLGLGGGVAAMNVNDSSGVLHKSTIDIKCANISDNSARFGGGAIYIDGDVGIGGKSCTANLYNAIITGNKSTGAGGGIQSCFETDKFVVKDNSLAIYGNTAYSAAYGPDITFEKFASGSTFSFGTKDLAGNSFKLKSSYNNGVKLHYDKPSQLGPEIYSEGYTSSPKNSLKPNTIGVALSNQSSAAELNSFAAVRITGNTAGNSSVYGRGGAIYSNSIVTFNEDKTVQVNKLVKSDGKYADKGKSYPFKVTISNNGGDFAFYKIYNIDKDGNVKSMVSSSYKNSIIADGDTIKLKAYQCAIVFGLKTGATIKFKETDKKGATTTKINGTAGTTATFSSIGAKANPSKTFVNEYNTYEPSPADVTFKFYKQASDYNASKGTGTSLKGTYKFTLTTGYNSSYSNSASGSKALNANITATSGRVLVTITEKYHIDDIKKLDANKWYYYKIVETTASPTYVGVNNSPIYVRVKFDVSKNKSAPIATEYSSDKKTWKTYSSFTLVEPTNTPKPETGRIRITKKVVIPAGSTINKNDLYFDFELRGTGIDHARDYEIKYKIYKAATKTWSAEKTSEIWYNSTGNYNYIPLGSIQDGDMIDIYKLPLGYNYSVCEVDIPGKCAPSFDVKKGNTVVGSSKFGDKTAAYNLTAADKDTGTPTYSFNFTNTIIDYSNGMLYLAKFVRGTGADTNKLFKFVLHYTDKNQIFGIIGFRNASGAVVEEYYGAKDGYVFYLKHGDCTFISATTNENPVMYIDFKKVSVTEVGSAGYKGSLYSLSSDDLWYGNTLKPIQLMDGSGVVGKDFTPKSLDSGDHLLGLASGVMFVNDKINGTLEITKTVTSADNVARDFQIKLDATGWGTTTCTYNVYDGQSTTSLRSGKVGNGGTIALKSGERVVVQDLPLGLTYNVTELGSPDYLGSITYNNKTVTGTAVGANVTTAVKITDENKVKVDVTNTYNGPRTGSLRIQKTVHDTTRTNDTFYMTVSSSVMTGSYPCIIYNAQGQVSTLNVANNSSIPLKTGQYAIISNLPFGTYRVSEAASPNYTGRVTVTDMTEHQQIAGEQNAAVVATATLSVDTPNRQVLFDFHNDFNPISPVIKVTKMAEGESLNGDTFSFTLHDVAANKDIDTASTTSTFDKSVELTFSPEPQILYDTAGVYSYTIKENSGDNANWNYNTTAVVNVTVTVTDSPTTGLSATTAYSLVSGGTTTPNSNTIVNTLPVGSVTLQAKKIGADNAILNKAFTFVAEPCDMDGRIIDDQDTFTATSGTGVNQSVANFPAITVRTEGIMYFAIHETTASGGGWACDGHVAYARVQFTRSGTVLVPTVTYGTALAGGTITGVIPNMPEFTNYRTSELSIRKNIVGGSTNDMFSFTVSGSRMALFAPYTYNLYNGNTLADTGTISNGGTVSIKANQSIRILNLPEGSYTVTETGTQKYASSVEITKPDSTKSTVTAQAGQPLAATGNVSASGQTTLAFNYTNTAVPGVALLQVEKVGRDFVLDKVFAFKAEECDLNGHVLASSLAYSSEASSRVGTPTSVVTFDSITVTDPCTRYFAISETTESGRGYICDNSIRYAKLVATRTGNTISVVTTYGTALNGGALTLESSDVPQIVNRKVGNMKISKSVVNGGLLTDEFIFTVSSPLMTATSGYRYDIYNISAPNTPVGSGQIINNGSIRLRANQFAIVKDLTVGQYTVTESGSDNYAGSVTVTKPDGSSYQRRAETGTPLSVTETVSNVGSVNLKFDFTNTWETSCVYTLHVLKSGNGKILNRAFDFKLVSCDDDGTILADIEDKSSVTGATTSMVNFSELTYTQAGMYYYAINEQTTEDEAPGWIIDSDYIYACVTVRLVGQDLIPTCVYGTGLEGGVISGVITGNPTVTNTKLGKLKISKTVGSGDTNKEFTFSVTSTAMSADTNYLYHVYSNNSSVPIEPANRYIVKGGRLTLKHNQYAIIEGLVSGNYTVVEDGDYPYVGTVTVTSVNGDTSTPLTGDCGDDLTATGTVNADSINIPSIDFENNEVTTDLTIRKNVLNGGSTSDNFTFVFAGAAIPSGRTYVCNIYSVADPDVSLRSSNVTNNSEITFNATEFAVIHDLPIGQYTITEKPATGYSTSGSVASNDGTSHAFNGSSSTGNIVENGTDPLTFTFNNYKISGTATLGLTKSGNGQSLDKVFAFQLVECDSNGTTDIRTIGTASSSITNATTQNVFFAPITYTAAGTHYYYMRETTTTGNGWTVPGTKIFAKVVVTQTGTTYTSTVTYGTALSGGNLTGSTSALQQIVNTKAGKLKIIKQTVDGNSNDDFTFKIESNAMVANTNYPYVKYNSANTQIGTGNVQKNGNVSLKSDQYLIISNLPIGSYTVTETTVNGYIPSATVSGAESPYNGELSKQLVVSGNLINSTAELTFTFNNVKQLVGSGPINVTKVGQYANLDKVFTFNLYRCAQDSSDRVLIQTKATTRTGTDRDTVAFDAISYSSDTITSYPHVAYYYIEEVVGSNDGWQYSEDGILVRQTVTKGNGVLNVVTDYATGLGEGDFSNFSTATQEIVNKKVGKMKISKTAINGRTDDTFKFTVSNPTLMTDSDGYSYNKYNATDNSAIGSGTITSGTQFSFKANEYIIIEGLPIGDSYVVTEVLPTGYKPNLTVTSGTSVVGPKSANIGQSLSETVSVTAANTTTVTCAFTNERELTGGVLLRLQKIGENSNLDREFEFNLYSCDENGENTRLLDQTTSDVVNSRNSTISFGSITYSTTDIRTFPAYRYYVMNETTPDGNGWISSGNQIYALVTITKGQDLSGNDILHTSVSYGTALSGGVLRQPTEQPKPIINTKLGKLKISKDSPNVETGEFSFEITSSVMQENKEYTYNVYKISDNTLVSGNQKVRKNGRITLSVGNYAIIEGLEFGEYTVSEVVVQGFKPTVTVSNPQTTVSGTAGQILEATGIVSKDSANMLTFAFTNTDVGDLKIRKTVSNGAVYDEFVFTVSVDSMIDGVDYEYFVYNIGGTPAERRTGVINKDNSTISIIAGQEILIKDLPVGTYSVTETGLVGYIGSVTVGTDNAIVGTSGGNVTGSGEIERGQTLTFAFDNEIDNNGKGFLQTKKHSIGSVIDKPFKFFMVECDANGQVLAGGETDTKETIIGSANATITFKPIELHNDNEVHYYKIYEEHFDASPDADGWIRSEVVIYAKLVGHAANGGISVSKEYGTAISNGNITGNPSDVNAGMVITHVNTKVGDLIISKEATGGNASDTFTFTITGELMTSATGYDYYIYNKGGTPSNTSSGKIKNGETITITRDKCILIKNLPTGKYNISEAGVPGYRGSISINGVQTAVSQNVGDSVSSDVTVNPKTTATATVAFINNWTKQGIVELVALKNSVGSTLDRPFEFTAFACDANGNIVTNGWTQTKESETGGNSKYVVFDSLPTFEHVGVYYFCITESIETGEDAGDWRYDSKTVYAVVTVTDDQPANSREFTTTVSYGTSLVNGVVSGNPSDNDSTVVPFVNSKVGDLKIEKTTTNGNPADRFTFEVTSSVMSSTTPYLCEIFNLSNTSGVADSTVYIVRGGTVTISADQYVIIRNLPLGTYSVTEKGQYRYSGRYTVRSSAEGEAGIGAPNEDLRATGTVILGSTVTFSFHNTKTVDDKAQFHITKFGRGSMLDKKFAFTLTQCDKDGVAIANGHTDNVTSEVGSTSSTVYFPNIVTYTTPGDYYYYIQESTQNGGGWVCDRTTKVYAKVTVTRDGTKIIAADPVYGLTLDNGVIRGDNSATISNERRGSLKISKTLRGGDVEQEFSFKVESQLMIPDYDYPCVVYNSDNSVVAGSITTVQSGVAFNLKTGQYIVISELPAGSYTVSELGTEGYVGTVKIISPDGTSATVRGTELSNLSASGVVVPDSQTALTFNFTNRSTDLVNFDFYKTNAALDEYLAGAEFALYTAAECANTDEDHHHDMTLITDNEDGSKTTKYYCAIEEYATATSDDDGHVVFDGLSIDEEYLLVETKSPVGYKLPKGAWLVTVDEYGEPVIIGDSVNKPTAFAREELLDENNQTYTVYKCTNAAYLVNPTTGGIGTIIFIVGGSLLMIAAIALFIIFMRKKSYEDVKNTNQKRRGEE